MRARLGQHLAALDLRALHAAQQHADVVARARPGPAACGTSPRPSRPPCASRRVRPTISTLSLHLHRAALHAARRHRAAARDREHVLHRHQERLVRRRAPASGMYESTASISSKMHWHSGALRRVLARRQRLKRQQGRPLDRPECRRPGNRSSFSSSRISISTSSSSSAIVHLVRLVHEDDDVVHAHLTGQQDVLAGLRHRAVRRRHDQDGAVHLRRARDHVLHVVGVAGAVHVRVVPRRPSRTPRAPC